MRVQDEGVQILRKFFKYEVKKLSSICCLGKVTMEIECKTFLHKR